MEDLSKKVLLHYLLVVDGLTRKGALSRAALQEVFAGYDRLSQRLHSR
jgi:hypothetical protein